MSGPKWNLARIALVALALAGHSSAQELAFDAASVKPSRADTTERSLTHNASGRLSTSNATLRMLILLAYQVMPYQLWGGPTWLESDGFDIDAKAANPGVTPAQFREMVQRLLADRFQLRIHRETKDLPIFALVVGKRGPRLAPAKGDEAEPGVRIDGAGHLTGVQGTMAGLANTLTRPLQRKVVDETGLTGAYNFQLQYSPQDKDISSSDAGPSLFTALEEQLGLSLKTTRGPVEVLVIDHAAMPSAN